MKSREKKRQVGRDKTDRRAEREKERDTGMLELNDTKEVSRSIEGKRKSERERERERPRGTDYCNKYF